MEKTCVLCKSDENRVVFHEFGVDILRCTRCGHVFSAWEADQDYDGYFGDALPESEEQPWWNDAHLPMYEDFCRRFIDGKAGRLLDVGCGLGFFVKHVTRYPSWQASGCEISRTAVEFAQQKLGLRNVHCGKVEDALFEKGSFDIITLWDVIEHIPDPDALLSSIIPLLSDDGLLFLHTPNIHFQLIKAKLKKRVKGMDPATHYLEAKDHLNIYSRETISRLLHRHGLPALRFLHLKPIQGVAGSTSRLMRFTKDAWFVSVAFLSWLTGGRLHLNNLFVAARRVPGD
jgi:SAM-dependent methyltransferase